MIGALAALAREDAKTTNPPTAARVFEGAFFALAFEAEVRALGFPVEGAGFSARPVGVTAAEILARVQET